MKIIASNFKTNHTRKSTKEFCKTLQDFLMHQKIPHKITIFPPATALLDNDFNDFKIGSQNAYPADNGSFTGEIGLDQLREFAINSLIIGHSERREILGESQKMCAKKFDFFKAQNFEIFYCIGESLEIKNRGLQATLNFLDSQLDGIDLNYPKLIIAYEPIWAIGTGVSASLQEIETIHTHLKQKLDKIPLLYGGSVKANNTKDILNIQGVDGVLIGSASWEISSFLEILKNSL